MASGRRFSCRPTYGQKGASTVQSPGLNSGMVLAADTVKVVAREQDARHCVQAPRGWASRLSQKERRRVRMGRKTLRTGQAREHEDKTRNEEHEAETGHQGGTKHGLRIKSARPAGSWPGGGQQEVPFTCLNRLICETRPRNAEWSAS
jgi:hypothetical protein